MMGKKILTKTIQKSSERGKSELGWLHSRFSFSFSDYFNPKRMGFGKLRVLNDDVIEPNMGFGMHPHKNMEIITIVLEGELTHKDSLGNEEVINSKDVQVMSAGSGIIHSEYNASETEQVKLLQIWIETKENGIPPRHDKKEFNLKMNKLNLIVCGVKTSDCLYIHQDANLYLAKFDNDKQLDYTLNKGHGVFIFVIEGSVEIDNDVLLKRDSIEILHVDSVSFKASKGSHVLVIDVPI